MGSYEQRAEVINKLRDFNHRNKTDFNKRDSILHEIQKHREHQSTSLTFRRNVLESQKRANYRNEYDRLRGAMHAGLVKETSNKHINERMGRLKDLASESIHGYKHDLYKPKTADEKTDAERLKEVNRKLAQHNKGNHVHNTMIVTPEGATSTVFT